MDTMQIFEHPEFGKVRVGEIEGTLWFVGKDVATALGYKDPADALKKHIADEDKLTRRFADSGQKREMYIINESGLYSLIFSSKLPGAKAFKEWVMDDIISALHSKSENNTSSKSDDIHCENDVFGAKTDKKIAIFNNPEFGEIRGIEIDGEPWLVGKDVAMALGYVDTDQALRKNVDEEYKLTRQIDGSDQNRNMILINEGGFYKLIFSSKLPRAKQFTHWVTSEILPSIRKTGMYISSPQYDINALSPSLQMAKMLSETLNTLSGTMNTLFESMVRTEMEQKRQAAEQERQAQEQKQQAQALETVDRKIDDIREIVVIHPDNWREECRRLTAAIAKKRGGSSEAYRDTNAEIFELVDRRGKVSLQTRLTNRRNRMAEMGASKSRQDKLNKVDVIAEDNKLIEIYIAIIKEKCIEYGASINVVDKVQYT